ncbi:hypothetical protein WUBG_02749 [Wuchereria bancrofti]|uniref:Uncharacterized protein n=1 Tax=Wuchereria bancrofti TaxID=6293 RepID=J9BGB2_WUCBA|nr:hypothetical protein WUBG_02749 [Wuchereria bancrofti]
MNEIMKNKKKNNKRKCLGLKLSVSAPPELLEPVRMDATERESSSFDVFICSIFIRIETTGSGTLPFNSVPALLFTVQVAPVSFILTIVVEASDSLALDNDSFNNSEKKIISI